MLPDQMLTMTEACALPPADPSQPATVDRLRGAREAGLLPGSRQQETGRRTWRLRLGDLVAAGLVSRTVYADHDGGTADLRPSVERHDRELADLREQLRVLRALVLLQTEAA